MTEKSISASNKKIHFDNIDVLRGIAILSVVIVHCTLTTGIYAKYFNIVASLGSFGVDLFFVISGFLITTILLRTKSEPQYFKKFYIRRMLRIFPLYYGFLVIFIIIVPIVLNHYSYPLYNYNKLKENQLFYWLYISNFLFSFHPEKITFFHLWSLSIEEQYYIFWPIVVRFFNYKTLAKILIVIIGISFISRCFFVSQHYGQFFIWSFTPIRLEAIAIGSLIGLTQFEGFKFNIKKQTINLLISITVLIITGLVIYLKGFYWNTPVVQTIGILLMDILFGLIVIKLINRTDIKNTFIVRILKKLGKYCYAIYMFHELILGRLVVKSGMLNFHRFGTLEPYLKTLVITLCTLIISYIVALLSWNLYEKWFIGLKDKLA